MPEGNTTPAMAPVPTAYLYDRHATPDQRGLDQRLTRCVAYAEGRGRVRRVGVCTIDTEEVRTMIGMADTGGHGGNPAPIEPPEPPPPPSPDSGPPPGDGGHRR